MAVPSRALSLGISSLAAIALACGGAPDRAETPTTERESQTEPTATVAPAEATAAAPAPEITATATPFAPSLPALDRSKHTVPLEEVYFDTFGFGAIPLSEVSEGTIVQLRDAIPPFYEGVYDPAAEGDWLEAGDLVLGYVAPSGQAYAYPHKILNFHELVNDEIDGIPVLVSYCPLCGSGVVFDRRLGGRMLRFGNTSALYGSDLVMFDWETNSYWWQVAREAIVGTLSGETLTVLASTTAQWSTWKSLHPETLVLTRNTGFNRNYSFDPFADYALQLSFGGPPFPVDAAAFNDGRLAPAERVLGVEFGGESATYSPVRLGDIALNDEVGGERIVIFSRSDGTAAAYFATSDGRALTFEYDGGAYLDRETASVWDFAGRAVSGELSGRSLEPAPSRSTFWFAYLAAFPETRLAIAPEESSAAR